MSSGIYKRTQIMKTGKNSNSRNGFRKGHKINLGKRWKVKDSSKMGKGDISGKKHGKWKGNHAKKGAMHAWVVFKKGKAKKYKCVDCGEQALDWSSIDHSYKRRLEDYFPRCRKCHQLYDLNILNIHVGRLKNKG